MFVYNIKINGSKTFRIIFICILILLIFIMGSVVWKIFNGADKSYANNKNISEIQTKNYTNILKAVHDNIDSYVGVQFQFTGYVYRVSDLEDNQFVLARDMIISSNNQAVVVGFLCEYENAKDLKDGTWVTITGKITKGEYHGDMPIVKVLELTETTRPTEEYVYPPDESYIPTDGVI